MLECILLVFVTTVCGISRISETDFKAVNFAVAKEGRKLNGNVIKEIDVESEGACRLHCVNEERCRSYNFRITNNKPGNFLCQLSESDKFAGFSNFTEDGDFKYKGTQSVCESSNVNPCGENGICIPNYFMKTFTCKCDTDYRGIPCVMKSCSQVAQNGFTSNGVHYIFPDGGDPMEVLCDMTIDGGCWTVIQRRLDGSVDFYQGWESYKNGFGDVNGEFWLGNDNLHRLTAAHDVILRIDVEDFDGNITYAEYTTFQVTDEADKYRITIGGYSGTAGDSMKVNGMQFSTKDADNDALQSTHCAQSKKGAWWYSGCSLSNLNGLYHNGGYIQGDIGMKWKTFRGHFYSLKRTEMKVKPKS
ncbi:microfibril-associated glycoprotein 4-like [Porites lutea]|uniref:microfibril-associated glycoprotein 4-like n=1 Tax=Porites lutea TaxID=51062 RepID=UPI003CC5A885